MSGNEILSFEIALDGTIQKMQGDINGFVPQQEVIHRLLFAAQKALIDEEVVSITATTDKYMIKISATGVNFAGVVTSIQHT